MSNQSIYIIVKKIILSYLTVILLFLFCFTNCTEYTTVGIENNGLNLSLEAKIHRTDREISWQDALNIQNWELNTKSIVNLGFTDQHIWLFFPVSAPPAFQERIIQLYSNQLDHVDFYLIQNGTLVEHGQAGDLIPYGKWTYRSLFPSFPFYQSSDQDFLILIHLRSTGNLTFQVNLSKMENYYRRRYIREMFLWVNALVELLNIAFLVFIYRKERNAAFLFLIPIIAIWYLISFYLSGPIFRLWPNLTHLQDQFLVLAGTSVSALNLLFVRKIFKIPETWPLGNACLLASFIATLYGIFSFVQPSLFNYKIYLWNTVQVYVVLFAVIMRSYWMGQRMLRFLFVIFLFQGLLSVIKNLAILEVIPYPPWVINTGSPIDLITVVIPLSFIIVIRYYYDDYQNVKKRNKELETEYEALWKRLQMHSLEKTGNAYSRVRGLNLSDILLQIQNMVEYNDCFYNENFNLSKMANILGIRTDQLSEIMNRQLNTSFRTFLNSVRIHRACKLLSESPKMKIIEITYESGFGSKAAFYEAFKEIMKMTPKQYLAMSRSNNPRFNPPKH